MKSISRHFSLLEVVIAVAILAMVFTGIMALMTQAKDNLVRAQEKWGIQHALEQATENYLICNPENLWLQEGILFEDYTATCEIYPVEEGLPEWALEPYRGWMLAEYVITVRDRNGEVVGENVVRKVIREPGTP